MTQLSDETVVGLLPCPFCGSCNVKFDGGIVACKDCNAFGPGSKESDFEMMRMWNRRAIQSGQEAEELKRCLKYVKCVKCGECFMDTPCDLADHIEAYSALSAHPSRKGDWEAKVQALEAKVAEAIGVIERLKAGPLEDKEFVAEDNEVLDGRYVQSVDFIDWMDEVIEKALAKLRG